MGWLLDFWRLGKTKNEVLQREFVEDEICEILKENTKGLMIRIGKRTGKGSGFRTSGSTGVGPVIEPVTS